MTKIYFIRHAQPDFTIRDDHARPLTEKGRKDCALVNQFLKDKEISVVLSSPYVRASDTVAGFAEEAGLPVIAIHDFRERRVGSEWVEDFAGFSKNQWQDFSYKLTDGESLAEVQTRNITALKDVLEQYKDRNIAIGAHGTALSTIINYYDNSYGYEDFEAMAGKMPWAVIMSFNGSQFAEMKKIDLI